MRLFWKPAKVFYGWWIVAASCLIFLYMGGVVFYGFTAIFEPIAEEFHWSYAEVSIAASIRGLELGLLAPIMGIIVDRWGPRRLIFSCLLIVVLGLFLLSRVTSLGMFYVAYFLVAIGMSACTTTVMMAAVVNWFRRKVGIASGIALCGFGFAGLMVPVLVSLIDLYGWRMTLIILNVGILVLMLPLSLIFRHKPEQYGYLPDGEVQSEVEIEKRLKTQQTSEVAIGLRRAFRTRAFWHIAIAFLYYQAVISSVVTHIMPCLSSVGFSRSTSSFVATAVPMTSIVGRLGTGWFGDRLNRKWVTAGVFAMIGLGLLCFAYVSSVNTSLLVVFCILFGIGYGGSTTMRPSLVRESFGRENFGTILGFIMGISIIGTVVGPPIAGWVFDNWGSYQGIWLIFAGLDVVAIAIMASSPSRVT